MLEELQNTCSIINSIYLRNVVSLTHLSFSSSTDGNGRVGKQFSSTEGLEKALMTESVLIVRVLAVLS